MLLERLSPDEMVEVSAIFEGAAKLGFQVLKKVYELKQTQKDTGVKQSLIQYSRETPFVFRGTTQDLSWFWSKSELPVEKISQLPEELQEQVYHCFSEMQKQGLVTFDGAYIRLTDEGKRYIHDTGYISEVVKADQELNQKIQESISEMRSEERFKPSSHTTSEAAPEAAQMKSTAVNSSKTVQQAGKAADMGAKAADASAKAAGTAAGATATAGAALAVEVAQEVVTSLDKSINKLLTHKQ